MDDADIHYAKSKLDSYAQTPSKFKYDEWIDWQKVLLIILILRKVKPYLHKYPFLM